MSRDGWLPPGVTQDDIDRAHQGDEPEGSVQDEHAAWVDEIMLTAKTYYWPKPIPLRSFDWVAVPEDYEPGRAVGYGPTEGDALADLQSQLEDGL